MLFSFFLSKRWNQSGWEDRGKSWNSTVMFAVIGDPNGFTGCFGGSQDQLRWSRFLSPRGPERLLVLSPFCWHETDRKRFRGLVAWNRSGMGFILRTPRETRPLGHEPPQVTHPASPRLEALQGCGSSSHHSPFPSPCCLPAYTFCYQWADSVSNNCLDPFRWDAPPLRAESLPLAPYRPGP